MKLVSLITKRFIRGASVLAYSLAEKGKVTGLDWIFIWPEEPLPGYEQFIEAFGFNAITMQSSDFAAQVPEFPNAKKHVTATKDKLLPYLLPDDDVYLSIDLDMVCKRDARHMLKFRHFTAMRRPGVEDFCAGLMAFRPSKKIYYAIVKDIIPAGDWELPDQETLNEYYRRHPEDVKILDWKWNTSQREELRQLHWPQLFEEAIFIHYHGPYKPWILYEQGYEDSHALWHETQAEALRYLKRNRKNESFLAVGRYIL